MLPTWAAVIYEHNKTLLCLYPGVAPAKSSWVHLNTNHCWARHIFRWWRWSLWRWYISPIKRQLKSCCQILQSCFYRRWQKLQWLLSGMTFIYGYLNKNTYNGSWPCLHHGILAQKFNTEHCNLTMQKCIWRKRRVWCIVLINITIQ